MNNKLLKRPEVEAVTGLSRASIYSKIKTGAFPAPVRLGPNSVAWRADEIDRWISELPVANELRDESRATAAGRGMFGESRPAAGGADRAPEIPRERAAGRSVAQQPIDWPALMPSVARALLGVVSHIVS